jgi:hypothetical protein
MRRVLSVMTVAVAAAALVLGLAPAASASDDLSGKWNAASRRGGYPGYSMKVTSADANPANAYFVVLRFHYQDGRVGPRIRAGMVSDGNKLQLVLNGKGGLADPSNPNIMNGTIGQDGSMYFPTCYKQLKFVTKKMAPQMCLFQEFPA